MTAEEIYKKGLKKPTKELFNKLIKKCGCNLIYYAGLDWPSFNYKEGLNALIKKDKTGEFIYLAGKYWPKFDYEKGIKALKKFPKYYKKISENWPLGKKELNKINKQVNKNKIIKPKKFSIKEEFTMNVKEIYELGKEQPTKNLFNKLIKTDKTGEWIVYAGEIWPKFYYKEGFNALIQKDKTGRWIYRAGKFWPEFDYEKGLDALIQKNKNEWIYEAGFDWPKFDYEKGLDALIKNDKTGEWIYEAGTDWKKFNYEKGLNALIKTDKTGKYIYLAGRSWRKFDYNKIIKFLKQKFPKYYEKALKDWPRNKIVLSHFNKRLKNNKNIKPKKFNIKEEILSLL